NATVELGAWTLQTGSAEGINVNNVVVTFPSAGSANTLVSSNQLSNVVLKFNGQAVNASPIGQPVVDSANNFSLSNIVLPINATGEFELYGTIGSSPATANVTPSMSVTY